MTHPGPPTLDRRARFVSTPVTPDDVKRIPRDGKAYTGGMASQDANSMLLPPLSG